MVEFELNISAAEALSECERRGLVVRSKRELPGRPSGHHWHLGFPDRAGTLEVSARQNRVWVKVHPRRDGGWATTLAQELATLESGALAAEARDALVERDEVPVMPNRVADR